MSTPSALLAPAAPVSTGPSAAALGAEAVDAGLFSSKVADALNAGVHGAPVERMTPGRLTGARSLGVIMAQPMAAEPGTDTPTPTTESVPTISGEIADSAVQPSLADEQQIGTNTAANDDDTPGLVAAMPFTAAQPTPAGPVAQSLDVASSPAASEDAAEIPADPQAPKSVVSVAFAAPEALTTTIPTAPRSATDTATKTASAPADQDLEAKTALAAATAQAVLSEVSQILTTEASPSSPAVAKPAEVKAAEASVTPVQPTMTDGPKPTVAPKPAFTIKGDAAPRPTDAATPAPATFDAAASTIQTAIANTDKPAAPSPITQSLAAAQIPTAQVQIAVTSTIPKPSFIAPAGVVAASTEAALSATAETADTADQPAEAAPIDTPKSPTSLQPASPLRGNLHAAVDQTSDAAVPAIQTATTQDATPSSAGIEIAAKPTSPSAKVAEAATGGVATPEPASPESTTASPAPLDAQPAQQAAVSSHAQGLTTLSRATVETTAQLAAQIARKLDGRSTRFDMVLTPEDLGRVDVSLEIGKDGQLSARLAFDNPAAAADLKGRADELRRQLQEAGFQVAGDALDFSQRDPSTGGGAFERQQQRNALFAGGSRLAAQADMPTVPAPGAWINHSLTPDRVDLKV
ncbi:flagellar hook-length control protein FliK [Brevundimonas sp. BT-123]|uniref:flagellar hook-length control protein FliK n=1 Tax=Brevundimonas sp. BT-123 TaxID=2986928 RepID=UPI0022362A88|nr:flagellar hook-length control protein FliK [Brevundimonas sp. BT-123]MCW0045498.1 flagellar hook-length control protein FliK [Brevundimonas sp. BT-123]